MNSQTLKQIFNLQRGVLWMPLGLFESVWGLPQEVDLQSLLDLLIQLESESGEAKQVIALGQEVDPKFFWQWQACPQDILVLPLQEAFLKFGAYFPGLVIFLEHAPQNFNPLEIGAGDFVVDPKEFDAVVSLFEIQALQEWIPNEFNDSAEVSSKVVFLDRDHVIVEDVPYNGDPEKVVLKEDAVAFIGAANKKSIPVVMMSNQSGVGRKKISAEDFYKVHERMLQLLCRQQVYLSDAYWSFYCPNLDMELIHTAPSRKPRAGMFWDFSRKRKYSEDSIMAGDKASDLFAAYWAGVSHLYLIRSPEFNREQELCQKFQEQFSDFKFLFIEDLSQIIEIL
ncbi:MAG: HAD-IIIA family hydrolase [Bdellovibrionia bacterium]